MTYLRAGTDCTSITCWHVSFDSNQESYVQGKTCMEHLLWIRPFVRDFHICDLFWSSQHNYEIRNITVVVQLLSHVWLFVTSWTAACQAPLSSTISQSLIKFMSIESVMLSNYLIFCHPLSRSLKAGTEGLIKVLIWGHRISKKQSRDLII